MTTFTLGRRSFLAGTAAVALTTPMRAYAQAATPAPKEFLLAGGMVIDVSGEKAVAARRDIHVRGSEIIEMGEGLSAPSAEKIDLSGMIVSPGLVDTHWHMWDTLARGLSMSKLGPFAKTMGALSKAWTPEAGALSVKLAMAEAVASGITTVHNWAHNTKSVEFAQAELAAMKDSGVRGRFSYGYPNTLPPDQKMDFEGFREFAAEHFRTKDDRLIELGLCTRGPDRSMADIWQEEWRVAREMKIPVTTHIASDRNAAAMGNIAKMAEGGYLGPDIQLVHATHATDEDFKTIKTSGSPLSISPWTELEVGYGLTPVAAMTKAELKPGLSVDNMILAGTANMFEVMNITADLATGQGEKQGILADDEVLRWATVEGARGLGLGGRVGELKKGMRADIMAVRADDLNTVNSASPAFLLTHAARPENVDIVMIDGVIHKRGGRLTLVDEVGLKAKSKEMIETLRSKADL